MSGRLPRPRSAPTSGVTVASSSFEIQRRPEKTNLGARNSRPHSETSKPTIPARSAGVGEKRKKSESSSSSWQVRYVQSCRSFLDAALYLLSLCLDSGNGFKFKNGGGGPTLHELFNPSRWWGKPPPVGSLALHVSAPRYLVRFCAM